MTEREAILELVTFSKEIKVFVENIKREKESAIKVYRRRKFLKFQYNGRRVDNIDHTEIKVKNWDHFIFPVIWHFRDSQRMKDVEQALKTALPSYSGVDLLSYVSKLVHILFQNELSDLYSINNLAKAFVKSILNQPLRYRITLELVGIILGPQQVRLAPKFVLSKIKKTDLERKIPLEYFENFKYATEKSTAKFELEYEDGSEYHSEFMTVGRYLTLLRLFKIGNIQYTSFLRKTESPDAFTSLDEVGSFNSMFTGISYMIKNNEVRKLQKFWKIMNEKIAEDFLHTWKRNDPISIAYERYSEALMRRGTTEMMLAYAVMGLEALLLEGEEEISYRLRMRVSRILQVLGLNGKTVFDDLAWAYKARSAFAHGSKLDIKSKKKINEKYERDDVLILKVLDYLRILIVTFLLIDKSKDEMIKCIDNSWLSDSELKQLKKSLSKINTVFNLKNYKPIFSFYPTNKMIGNVVI